MIQFLEASLCFPIADFVIGNPPYIRLEEISASKAAFYQLKPGGVFTPLASAFCRD